MRKRVGIAALCLFSLLVLAGCGGSSGGTANRAPAITSQTSISGSVDPGEVVALSVTASDPDGDTLAYAWSCTAGELSATSGSSVDWTAPASGSATVTVTVTDGKGGTAQTSWSISVASGPPNSDPVITSKTIYSSALRPGMDYAFQVTATDADDDPLTYAWSCNVGTLSSTSGASITWTSPPRTASATITVEVTDGKGGSTQDHWDVSVDSQFEGTWSLTLSDGNVVTLVVGDLITRSGGPQYYEFYAGYVTTSFHPGETFSVTSAPPADQWADPAYEMSWTNYIYSGGGRPFMARVGSWGGAMVKWQGTSLNNGVMTGEIAVKNDLGGQVCFGGFEVTKTLP